MANKNFGTEKEIALIKKNARGEYVKVTESINANGDSSTDIRQMYTDDDEVVRHTQKGIRFSSELTLDVVKALCEILEGDELDTLIEYINTELQDK